MAEEMLDDKQIKHGHRPGLVLIIIVVVIAIVFGLAGYYLGRNVSDKTATVATPIATVTSAVETTTPKASATTSTDPTADWKTYTNDTYGFTIIFTDKWEGYRIREGSLSGNSSMLATYRVYVPTSQKDYPTDEGMTGYVKPFVIMIYDKSTYENLKNNADPNDPFDLSYGSKLADNGTYVATYSSWQDSPTDLVDSGLVKEVSSVIHTFKFTK